MPQLTDATGVSGREGEERERGRGKVKGREIDQG